MSNLTAVSAQAVATVAPAQCDPDGSGHKTGVLAFSPAGYKRSRDLAEFRFSIRKFKYVGSGIDPEPDAAAFETGEDRWPTMTMVPSRRENIRFTPSFSRQLETPTAPAESGTPRTRFGSYRTKTENASLRCINGGVGR